MLIPCCVLTVHFLYYVRFCLALRYYLEQLCFLLEVAYFFLLWWLNYSVFFPRPRFFLLTLGILALFLAGRIRDHLPLDIQPLTHLDQHNWLLPRSFFSYLAT